MQNYLPIPFNKTTFDKYGSSIVRTEDGREVINLEDTKDGHLWGYVVCENGETDCRAWNYDGTPWIGGTEKLVMTLRGYTIVATLYGETFDSPAPDAELKDIKQRIDYFVFATCKKEADDLSVNGYDWLDSDVKADSCDINIEDEWEPDEGDEKNYNAERLNPIDEWPYEVEDNEYDGFDEGRADDRRHGI